MVSKKNLPVPFLKSAELQPFSAARLRGGNRQSGRFRPYRLEPSLSHFEAARAYATAARLDEARRPSFFDRKA